MLAGGVALYVFSLATGEFSRVDLSAVSGRSVMALFYLIVFGSLIGFTAYAWLLRVCTPAAVATYAYVNPMVAMLLGWLIAGEEFGPRMVLAAAIILSGVALINRASGRPRIDARASTTVPRPTEEPPAAAIIRAQPAGRA